MKKLFVFIGFLVAITGCGNYNNSTVTPPSTGGPTKTDTKIDFATIKKEILDNNCISCHTGRHAAYENYAIVKASLTSMIARMETSNPARLMPQGGPPLDPSLIAMFKEWVEAGAPETVDKGGDDDNGDDGDGGGDDKDELGFAEITAKVLKPYNCTACHAQYNDYISVYKARTAIFSVVMNNSMPFPKRKNRPVDPVSDADKKILSDWILGGAPEFPGSPVPTDTEQVLKPNYQSLRNQVFGPKCTLCHNSFANRGGGKKNALETYTNLRNWFTDNPDLFHIGAKEDESQGLLFETIIKEPCKEGELCFPTPMPLKSDDDDVGDVPRVTPDEIEIIKQWINLKLPQFEGEL